MATKKTPKKDVRKALYEQYLNLGMKPYNAAIKAGYGHTAAIQMTGEAILERLQYETLTDIAEQEGMTPRALIKHLIERAGLLDRERGAKKIVGTENDFIEAPDDKCQLDYLKELLSLTGYKKGGLIDEKEDDSKPQVFDIRINVLNIATMPKDEQEVRKLIGASNG